MSENQITRIFGNHPIFILKEVDDNDKNQFYFKAADVGKVLELTNIHASTQHFNEKEKGIREIDTPGGLQKVSMLTSRGVYRLLFASKKPIAEKFRDWASDVLDDIIFNESQELKKRLEEQEEELKQKEIENQKQAKELKQKEIENKKLKEKGNWLYEKTVKKVTFKKRIHKNLAIYVASNIFEKENNIFKIGKSICMKERRADLRTGSAPDNSFKMHKSYDVVDGLEIATERYLHALMDSFHIDDKSNTEHFMAHMEFIDLIVADVIQNQFHNINLMNDYIKVLDKHNFDFKSAKPDIIKFIEKSKTKSYNKETKFTYDMKQTTKVCQTCIKDLPIFKFEGENCIDCIKELERIDLLKKKKCDSCDTMKYKEEFFKDINCDNEDKLIETCMECYNKENANIYRSCNVCMNIKLLDDFGVNHIYEDRKSKKCKECSLIMRQGKAESLPKKICDICNVEMSPNSHLPTHQKTKSCIAASKKNINPLELIKAQQESQKLLPVVSEKEIAKAVAECFKCGKSHDRTLFFKMNDTDAFTKTCLSCFDDSLGQLYKHCNKCNTTKLFDEFNTDTTQKSGKKSACKSCNNSKKVGKTIICEICNKEVSVANLKRHQKTSVCKAPEQ